VYFFIRLHAAVSPTPPAAATLSSYVPQAVAERLASGQVTQEELVVTVLFSDIRGFSTIAERLEAREIAEIVLGDAVLGVCGAPNPLADHAQRALDCAIAMQRRQAELNSQGWGTDAVPTLDIGVGLNTGQVIAGAVGGGGRLEYTVIGDAVNVASRLQSEAEGGEIVASATTIASCEGVSCEPMGHRTVKGREEPVEVYRVIAEDVIA
jgi:class 3 adenylate cyclase